MDVGGHRNALLLLATDAQGKTGGVAGRTHNEREHCPRRVHNVHLPVPKLAVHLILHRRARLRSISRGSERPGGADVSGSHLSGSTQCPLVARLAGQVALPPAAIRALFRQQEADGALDCVRACGGAAATHHTFRPPTAGNASSPGASVIRAEQLLLSVLRTVPREACGDEAENSEPCPICEAHRPRPIPSAAACREERAGQPEETVRPRIASGGRCPRASGRGLQRSPSLRARGVGDPHAAPSCYVTMRLPVGGRGLGPCWVRFPHQDPSSFWMEMM